MKSKVEAATLGEMFVDLGYHWFEKDYPEGLTLKSRSMVFNSAVTMWVMVLQRGAGEYSLASAIQQFKRGGDYGKIGKLLKGSRKYALGDISTNPGGFSHARQRLPLNKAEAFADYIGNAADKKCAGSVYGYRAYALDGSTIALENNAKIREEFPAQRNQHGDGRPGARVVVANNIVTGVGYRPEIGSTRRSEQTLAIPVLTRLPDNSLVIMDRNFGVFSVAWNAVQTKCIPVVRLTKVRALKVLGKKEIPADGDYHLIWTPSRDDRRTNELPSDAAINGRLIVHTLNVPGKRAERIFIFTTASDLNPEQIVDAYKQRWFIETDLKSIKQTVDLDMVHARTPEMARKEIILGIVAYSMIRAVIAIAANSLGLKPRQISFKRAREHIDTTSIRLGRSKTVQELQLVLADFFKGIRQMKHPKRTKFRSEPRVIAIKRRLKFPIMKGTREEARQAEISKRLSGC